MLTEGRRERERWKTFLLSSSFLVLRANSGKMKKEGGVTAFFEEEEKEGKVTDFDIIMAKYDG